MVDKTSYVNINRLFYQWTIHQIFSCNYSWKKKQETLEDKRHTNWWNIRQSRPIYGWKTQVSQAQWLNGSATGPTGSVVSYCCLNSIPVLGPVITESTKFIFPQISQWKLMIKKTGRKIHKITDTGIETYSTITDFTGRYIVAHKYNYRQK